MLALAQTLFYTWHLQWLRLELFSSHLNWKGWVSFLEDVAVNDLFRCVKIPKVHQFIIQFFSLLVSQFALFGFMQSVMRLLIFWLRWEYFGTFQIPLWVRLQKQF